jgi:hypothetical protein
MLSEGETRRLGNPFGRHDKRGTVADQGQAPSGYRKQDCLAGSTSNLFAVIGIVKVCRGFYLNRVRSQHVFRKCIAWAVTGALISSALPPAARGEIERGSTSADGAARNPRANQVTLNSLASEGWKAAFAAADTTEYEFPEEEKHRNIVREVTLWVVVSAFVAFFMIKVFLQGDTSTPPPSKTGKPPPPPPTVSQPSMLLP